MKQIFLILLITGFSVTQTMAVEYGVAIPITHNPIINEWEILLGLHQDNQ